MHIVSHNLVALNAQYSMTPAGNIDADTLKLHLGRPIHRPIPGKRVHFTGTDRSQCFKQEELESGVLRLEPSECVLACTEERVVLPAGYSGIIMPTSTANRDFLSVTLGADLVSAGWSGHLTLEMRNNGPFVLEIPIYAHIAQLLVIRCSDSTFTRTSRYSNHNAPSFALDRAGSAL